MNNIYKDSIIVLTVFIGAVYCAVVYDNYSQKKLLQGQIDTQQLASTSAVLVATTTDEVKGIEDIKSDTDSGLNGNMNSYNDNKNTEIFDAEDEYINYKIRENEREADIMAQEAEQEAEARLDQMEQEIMDGIERDYIDKITDKAIDNY